MKYQVFSNEFEKLAGLESVPTLAMGARNVIKAIGQKSVVSGKWGPANPLVKGKHLATNALRTIQGKPTKVLLTKSPRRSLKMGVYGAMPQIREFGEEAMRAAV